jgi:hypothetical protein
VQRLLAVHCESQSGYVLGGDPHSHTLCAVLREGHDDADVQFEAAMHAGFVRQHLHRHATTARSTAAQLVEAIEVCRPWVVAEAPAFKAVLRQAGWQVGAGGGGGWLQFNVAQKGWRLVDDGSKKRR